MKSYFRSILAIMLILGFFFCQPNAAFAVKEVDISIYYERVEQVIDLSKTDINSVPVEDGYYIKYSKTDGYAYKMKRTEIKTDDENELLAAMGVSDKSQLKYGQECILAAFKAATSQDMKDRAGASYRKSVELDLFDTSYDGTDSSDGYKTGPYGSDASTTPNLRQDFWPCSTADKKRISVSDVRFKYMDGQTPSGTDSAYTTVFHEYGHFMDKTKMESGAYGLDGTHYFNEITKPRAAFMEGWAEYNEMIENDNIAQMYIDVTKSLCVESETEKGKYTTVDPKDATFQQLLSAESYNALLLYRLSQELGEDAITDAFVATRWNTKRNISNLVSSLIAQNPESASKICEIIDEVFLHKATTEEFLSMVGSQENAFGYIYSRDTTTTSADTPSVTPTNGTSSARRSVTTDGDEKPTWTNITDTKDEKPTWSNIASSTSKPMPPRKIASGTIVWNDNGNIATFTLTASGTSDISGRFTNLFDKLKNKFSKLFDKAKSFLEKMKEFFEKLFGKSEDKDDSENEPVDGIVIDNNDNNEEIKPSDEEITVEGNSSNPFADEE